MKKRLFSLCLILAVCFGLAVPAAADLLQQSDAFYVADYANVLSADLEEDIYWTNYEELYEYCDGAEIVVVTVDNTGGMNTEDYCYKVFNEWGIGGEKNNGVLILLSIYDKKYFTMVGKNLMDDLDADVLNKFQSGGFEEAFDSGRYDEAVEVLFQNCLNVLRTKFAGNYTDGSEVPYNSGSALATILGGALIMVLVIVIILVVINSVMASASASHTRQNYGGGSPLFWWALGRSSARHHHHRAPPPPPPPRPRGTTGYTNSRGPGGMGGGSFGAAGRRTTGSGFSGSFRGSSGGRGMGGGRMGGGGGRSFGGGSGRR